MEAISNTLCIDETMPIPRVHASDVTQSSYNTTIQCNITSEGASVAKCDKNITTEIGSKLISHGGLLLQITSIYKR